MADNFRFSYPESSPELHRFVRRQQLKRIIYALLWFAAWVAGCTLWGRGHTAYLSFPNWILLGILIGLAGLPLFGVVTMLRDRPFEGTIVGMTQRIVLYREWLLAPRVTQELQITAVIDVGREKPIRYRFPPKMLEPKEYYVIGDRVRHYRGLVYLEREDKSDEETLCLVCGKFTFIEDGVCECCGAPLVK